MKFFDALQECDGCGRTFIVRYFENGNYDYIDDDDCECAEGTGFHPCEGVPSISEWLESIKE